MNENTNKTTYKTAVEYAIKNLQNAPAEVVEKLKALQVSLEKKSGAERKPTANQVANQGYQEIIVAFLTANPTEKYLAGDLIKEIPEFAGFSTSKISSLLSPLVAGGRIGKVTDKRRSYFCAKVEG